MGLEQYGRRDSGSRHRRRHHSGRWIGDDHGDVYDAKRHRFDQLYIHRSSREHRIVDISLLPAYRGRGIGTRLLTSVIAEADSAGKPVSIHVEVFNPARRLYERLGFVQIEDKGVYLLMERAQVKITP